MALKRNNEMDILHGPLLGKIIAFAVPMAICSVFQQLFNSADAAVAGRYVGNEALAAIGGMTPVIGLLISLFGGLSIGANVVVANAIGEGHRERIHAAVQTAMVVALASGTILFFVGQAVMDPILDAIAIPDNARLDADLYLRVYLVGMPFMVLYNFCAAILRSKGDSRRPMYSLIVSALVNLGLNMVAVRVFESGVLGIAIATCIANAINALIVVWFLRREQGEFHLDYSFRPFDRRALGVILRIGIPAGLQGMVFAISNVLIQATINSFGSQAMAGSAAAMNYEYYTYFLVSAFTQTAVTFIGQNYAAGNFERCDAIMWRCMALSLATSFALSVVSVALGERAVSVFATETAAIGFGMVRLWHVELLECLPTLYEVPAGAMRGMGWSTLPTVIIVVGSCVLRILWVMWVFPLDPSFEMLMNVYPISWVVTGSAMMVASYFVRKRAYAKKSASRAA